MGKLFEKGHTPWNKGLKRPEISGSLHPFHGKKHSKETIEKMKATFKKKYPNGRPIWNKGKKHSEKTKEKISKAKKGRPNNSSTKFKKGDISPNKGKTLEWMLGEKNPNWKGGVVEGNKKLRATLEYKLWRLGVFERDGYACKKCGAKKPLRAHHIKNFHSAIKLRYSISNGITFCNDCHKLFHKLFGILDNNRKQLNKFLAG